MVPLTAFICFLLTVTDAVSEENVSLVPTRKGEVFYGIETDITDAPYTIAIEHRTHILCAGALLSPYFAITAAHCLIYFAPSDLLVRAGSTIGGALITVSKLHFHPKYKSTKLDYDVALLELEPPFDFLRVIKPISLTNRGALPGEIVKISAWGVVQQENQASLYLQYHQLPVLDLLVCEDFYGNVGQITTRMLCAGAPGVDNCRGESGSPVVINQHLVGIVSRGQGCQEVAYPIAYTNLVNNEITFFIRSVIGN